MIKDALISPCERYRFWLLRSWDETLPRVCWVMLNPSTADADRDDPTIRKCIHFSRAWGFGSLTVVNLFARRATMPVELYRMPKVVGPNNDGHIQTAADLAHTIVAAWGGRGGYLNRDATVTRLLRKSRTPVKSLGLTDGGRPRHPLYVRNSVEPVDFPLSCEGAFV